MANPLLWAVIAVGLSAAVQIATDPRITREFIAKSLLALAVFAGQCAIGIVFMILVVIPSAKASEPALVGIISAWLGWLGLAMLGLIRAAPRLREPPRVLMRVGVADAACLVLIAGGLAAALL